MSDTKPANQGAVTSIGDTDLVMCHVGGAYHPISFANLMKAVCSGIQIGGRNLLKNTSEALLNVMLGPYSWVSLETSVSHLNLKDGEQFVFSAYVENTSTCYISLGFELRTNDSNRITYASKTLNPGESGRLIVTGTMLTKYKFYRYRINNRSDRSGEYVKIGACKLERGTISTDWTPAPEDIASGAWGGVNQRITISYNLDALDTRKGGAHERPEKAYGHPEIGADGYLSFGSLGSACRYLGRVCEDRSNPDSERKSRYIRFERGKGLENIHYKCFKSTISKCAVCSEWHDPNQSWGLPFYPSSWRRRTDLLPIICKYRVGSLETNLIKGARKEVAV